MLSGSTPCPGLFYATPAQDGILSRIRIPGGIINSKQCQAIADIADKYGGGYIDVTNRANLQIREIREGIEPEVLQQLQDLGLGSNNSGVDQIRNIMTSPTAGIDPQELIDTRPFVQNWDNYITQHSTLSGLSAKFSVCFDGGGLVSVCDRPNDITLAAIAIDNKTYFRLYLSAGAKGKPPTDTRIILPPEHSLKVLAAFTQIYLTHSHPLCASAPLREKINPHTQRKPRLREVINHLGLDNYLQEVEQRLPFYWKRKDLTPEQRSNTQYHHIGIHPQHQPELYYIGIVLPLGRLETQQLRGLADLSEKYSHGTLRLTPWQNLLLTDIPQQKLTEVQREITDLKLDASPTNIKSALVACSGNQGCAAAATDTKTHALALADYLQSHVTLEHPVNIHLSGCEKSCAQHGKSDIALLGVSEERYQVYVGDSNQKFGRELYDDVSFTDLPALMEQMLNVYKNKRLNPAESFGEFANRYPHTQLQQLFSHPNSMPEYIRDANEIYRNSFAIIRSEANLDILPADVAKVAVRLIHACGMTDIVTDLGYSATAVQSAREALAAGAPILCDCRMVADGVTRKRLSANNQVICTLNEPEVPELAKKLGNTRSAAALELWQPYLAGAVVAIGNAPTALFRLLEMLDQGCPKPAVILGFPVGFVGAAESKAALAADSRNVPFLTLHGRRGGSAIAAAAVNALATEEE
ncbi:precorrin-8X methylmutase [Nostoc sp. UHCC 0870]|nr:precorrin-8X methylmutase [Nostoc sp. UHCC 0870]UKO97975.1 precorrin-8X methylmutase [Nostoc sp. UHCC 0870]